MATPEVGSYTNEVSCFSWSGVIDPDSKRLKRIPQCENYENLLSHEFDRIFRGESNLILEVKERPDFTKFL